MSKASWRKKVLGCPNLGLGEEIMPSWMDGRRKLMCKYFFLSTYWSCIVEPEERVVFVGAGWEEQRIRAQKIPERRSYKQTVRGGWIERGRREVGRGIEGNTIKTLR